MFLLRFLEWGLGILALLIVMTQVVVPLLMNKPIFWLLRRTPAKEIESLRGKLANARDADEAARLREELEDLLRQFEDKRNEEIRRLQEELAKAHRRRRSSK